MSKYEQIHNVEEVLATFSKEAQQNYYTNKKTIQIGITDGLPDDAKGSYNSKDNAIQLVNIESLEHELFHMAFNNKRKYSTQITPGIYLGNGVSYMDDNNKMHGIGLTEGLAESLSVKSKGKSYGRYFQYRIIDILVSIYGNEIYEFALKNDPIGFYEYFSDNIYTIRDCLDAYTKMITTMNCLSKKNETNEIEDYEKDFAIETCTKFIPYAICMCIKGIITEYNSHQNPSITRNELREQIEDIFSENKLQIMNLSEQIKMSLLEEVNGIIESELMIKTYIKQ